MKLTVLAIAAFFLAVAGSFIWFVLTWDPNERPAVGAVSVQTLHLAEFSPGAHSQSAQAPGPGTPQADRIAA
ncbi:hypothetical protein KUH32_07245 [Thalassococcus sp. CAU 1522]|uniref:Uncharacterized protein n=1 Tax=Thalassococcus arenae TaxID=2851652 RepID=A0ABS6N6Z6_9RHOB|nr:hypothetical protein [Thalassococcus arenae]MBV2359563.1 hypothetical protein [Thalassococcus arenae]